MLFFALLAGIVGALTQEQYDGNRIAAGTFSWPEGCEPRQYARSARLPKVCFDRFQKISPKWAAEHGLKRTGRKRRHYYRLGNDAVEPLCVVWEQSCTIEWIYPELFVVDSKIAETTSAGWRTIAPGENN